MTTEFLALVTVAAGRWPEHGDDPPPRPIAGFVLSSFSPLAAEAADRCLRRVYGDPPAEPTRGRRTAVVISSRSGDVATAAALAEAVDDGRRVPPLLFFQAVPNAVAGHIAARWGLGGPVVCLSPAGDAAAEALSAAALLIHDGDADEALVLLVELAELEVERPERETERETARDGATAGDGATARDGATALLVRPGTPEE